MINLCALAQCTSMVTSKSLNKDYSLKFSQMYEVHQATSFELFENVKLNPNHHYTMHLPDHIDWWGPPMGVSEFGGERLVGILQNINNYHSNGAMEETLMKKFSQKQCLKVQTPDTTTKHGGNSKKVFELRRKTYERLFEYLQSTHPHFRDFCDLPHPQNALVLTNY
ncbi:hypothetical protein O181_042674 [Austropuccinia psidii MF-1]|uniref:Uncharacterized protein n=1 Tax=Austropuccinia psidii MF-1 TaxID=1389203 RepID=A0A9Q3HHP7_9BASI|nr:hypothetical protein [Austropuccinia psidii MF-1]